MSKLVKVLVWGSRPVRPVKIGVGRLVHARIGSGQTVCGLGSGDFHNETVLPDGTPLTCSKCQRQVREESMSIDQHRTLMQDFGITQEAES